MRMGVDWRDFIAGYDDLPRVCPVEIERQMEADRERMRVIREAEEARRKAFQEWSACQHSQYSGGTGDMYDTQAGRAMRDDCWQQGG